MDHCLNLVRLSPYAPSGSPPVQRPVGSGYDTTPKKNQPGGRFIFIPIGLILTLIFAIARSCGSGGALRNSGNGVYNNNSGGAHSYSDYVVYDYNSGMRYYAQGDYQMALTEFNGVISSSPKFAEAYNGCGLVYDAQDDYALALADFDKAIELAPESPLPYNNRGCVFFEQDEFDRAISDFDKAILLRPNLAKAYFNRGLVYYISGDFDTAIADFTKAIEYTPEDSDRLQFRQVRDATPSIFDESMQDSQTVEDLESPYADLPTVYGYRGLAYASLGDISRAQADWDKLSL